MPAAVWIKPEEPLAGLAENVHLWLENLQEHSLVPRARVLQVPPGCCTAAAGFLSVKFTIRLLGESKEERQAPAVFCKPFSKHVGRHDSGFETGDRT